MALLVAACGGVTGPVGAGDDQVRILQGPPATLDPAAQGDAGSAAVTAQLFETLTTFDASQTLQPALARSWQMFEDGRRIVFQLRPDLSFSDGSALRASDVVRSWLRLLDPAAPSPLMNLMLDVEGARAYLDGSGTADAVGLHADDAAGTVTVELVRPAGEFLQVVAGPSFAVVPPGVGEDPAALQPGAGFVASGGYVLKEGTTTELTLEANPQYWAGPPEIETVTLVGDLGGASQVEAFEDGRLDYAPIGTADATWIAYDETLGRQLRSVPSLSTDYFGFDASRPPFDDVQVRQAFAEAVDWRRMARLAASDGVTVATSMVPPGIPGRSDRDVLPPYDPDDARGKLEAAGYPGGSGFPDTTMLTAGTSYDRAIVTEIRDVLGVTLHAETMEFDAYVGRLVSDPPAMWALSWVADYPGRNDFLGLLLETGASNNYGRWRSKEFDAAIAAAGAAPDDAAVGAAYDRAEAIVQRDAPVVPVSYGTGWALARDGLLGADQNGLGMLRMAGLAWAP
jgi:ABC-type transport system substrate-binding protein